MNVALSESCHCMLGLCEQGSYLAASWLWSVQSAVREVICSAETTTLIHFINPLALHCNLAKASALGLGGGLCPLVLLLRHSASPAPSVAAACHNTAGWRQGLVAVLAVITHTAAAHYISPWANGDGATPDLSLIHIISPQWEKLKDHQATSEKLAEQRWS